MTEEKKYKKEWSFSFEQLGDDLKDAFQNLTGTKEGEDPVKHETFTAGVDGATSARVRIDLSVGETDIAALPVGSTDVIVADLTHIGEIKFVADTNDEGERVVSLSHVSTPNDWIKNIFNWVGNSRRLRWDIHLNPTLPTDLEVVGGVGKSDLDLSGLNLKSLRVSSGAGEINLTLPGGVYSARVDCGVGQVNLTVKHGATLDLQLGGGTGEINLTIEDGASVSTRIRAGVGAVNVRVPEAAAVKLNAKSGIGDISVAPRIPRVSGSSSGFDRSGMWQSPGYEASDLPITIQYEGGVGSLSVK